MMQLRPELQHVSPAKMHDLAKQAKMDGQQWTQDFIRAVVLSDDPKLEQSFCEILAPYALEALLRGIPFTNPTRDQIVDYLQAENPILLGFLFESQIPLTLPSEIAKQHIFVAGGSGAGKTNLLTGFALQSMAFGSCWVIDFQKQDYRHCIKLRPDLLVFDTSNFAFNPLEVPPGVRPQDHLVSFVTTFCKSNALLDGSESLALKLIKQLYEEFGVFEGGACPTLYDFRKIVAAYKTARYGREAGYKDSILNRLDAYSATNPRMYSYSRGFCIADLAQRSFVLELKSLSERHARCLVGWLLTALFNYRVANNERGSAVSTPVTVIADECKYLVPPGFNANIGFSPIASLLAQSREVGIGFVFADQTAQLDEAVFVQTRTKLCMRLGSGEDMKKVEKTFALSPEQSRFIPKLDVGQAIVRVPQIDPFLIQVPKVRLG